MEKWRINQSFPKIIIPEKRSILIGFYLWITLEEKTICFDQFYIYLKYSARNQKNPGRVKKLLAKDFKIKLIDLPTTNY